MKKLTRFISLFVATSMLLSLAACSDTKSKKKSKDKDDEETEFSEKEAKSAAEDYVKALLAFDADKANNLSTGLKDGTIEYISGLEAYDDAKDVYEAWYDTFEYEINEDDIEVDDEEATVPVTIKYIKIDSLSVSDNSTDTWLAAIKDADTDSELSLDIEVEYDEDEEKALVSNGDDVANDFMDIVDVYIYVSDFQYYDDVLSGSWSEDEYVTTAASLDYTVEFADIDKLDGEEIEVYLIDPGYDEVYEATIKYTAGESAIVSISPKDIKADEFSEGYYTIEFDNDSFYFSDSVWVNKDDSGSGSGSVVGGNTGLSEGDIIAPDDECLGVYDDTTKVYTNEYFGFEYTLPDDMKYIDPSYLNINSTEGLENVKLDYVGMGSDGSMVMHMFGKIAILDGADEEIASEFVNQFLGGGAGAESIDGKSITFGNTQFVQFSKEGYDFLVTIKDSNACFIIYGGSDEGSFDDFISTMKGI